MRGLRAVAVFLAAMCVGMGVSWGAHQSRDESAKREFSVTIRGPLGSADVVSTSGPIPRVQVIKHEAGSGEPVKPGQRILYVSSSFDDRGRLLAGGDLSTATLDSTLPYSNALTGLPEGSRLWVVNPQGTGAEIIVIDLLHSSPQGTDVAEETGEESSLPLSESNGTLLMTEPYGSVGSLSTIVLARGDGAQVFSDDSLFVNYWVFNAESGDLIDAGDIVYLDLSQTLEGLAVGVDGLRIGSRVALLIPAAEAQGDHDMIVVLDLLALPEPTDVGTEQDDDATGS